MKTERNLVRGLGGLAKALEVSYATAKRIKASGLIDKATYQNGRVMWFDVDRVITLWTGKKLS